MISHARCLLVLIPIMVAVPAGAADPEPLPAHAWPQFHRDARRSGDHPDAAIEFPLTKITAVRFPAPIYASPAVLDGRVYIQDAWGNVACIDAAKNAPLWSTCIGGFNNTSSPAVVGGKVYVGSSVGALFILDAGNGKVLNKVPAPGGVFASPAFANNAVYFSTFAGQLNKIDLAGNLLWTFAGGRLSTTEFALLNDQILFFAGSSGVNLYHLRDEGTQVRVVSKTLAPSNCVPMSGPVFITPESYAFQSFDSEFGRFYWMTKEGKKLTSGDISDSRVVPAVRGDKVYRGDKCFTLEKGLKTLWRTDSMHLYDGGFHSSPALARDTLVVGCEQGKLQFYNIESPNKTRKPRWQFTTASAGEPNSAVSSSPAVVDGKVFFGCEDGILYGLGQGNEAAVVNLEDVQKPELRAQLKGSEWPTPGCDAGFSFVSTDREVKPPFEVEWKTRIWSVFKAPMVVAEGKVFCGGRLGGLTALDAATGAIQWKFHHPGVESRPGPTYAEGKVLIMRTQNAQGDSPYISGASGGPRGEGLWCHDAANGKVLWHRPIKFKYHFNHDGLTVDRGAAFVIEQTGKGDEIQAVAYALDTGRELWRRPLEVPSAAAKKGSKLPPRFSGVMAGGLWCVSISDRATVALDPADGKTVWSNDTLFITMRTRIAARDDTLVVFTDKGDFALEPRTGKPLWKGAATVSKYTQALTDRYLESKGQQGIYPPAVCAWPVYANGHWYSHHSYTTAHGSNKLACMKEPESGDVEQLGPKMVVWSHDFLSNACPAPSPAYGRLFYSPASEGVIYSFRPIADKSK